MPTADGMMMTEQLPRPARDFARLASVAFVVSCGVAALGWFPTQRIAGADAWVPMLAGIAVSMVASLAAAIPLSRMSRLPARDRHTVTLMAMAIRMAVTMALVLAVVFGTGLSRTPFVLWAGISYLAQLAAETIAAVRLMQASKP